MKPNRDRNPLFVIIDQFENSNIKLHTVHDIQDTNTNTWRTQLGLESQGLLIDQWWQIPSNPPSMDTNYSR